MNTTQISAIAVHGFLYCSYDFSQTPEKTSCRYREATGVTANYNVVWTTAGSFLSTDGQTTEDAASQSGIVTLGNFSSITIGGTTTPSQWHKALKMDWSDYGQAAVSYGRVDFASTIYSGVVVQFPQDVATIDPTLVQNSGFGSFSCSFSSSVTSGDVLIVATDQSTTPTDTRSTSFSQQVSASYTAACNLGAYYCNEYGYIFSGKLASSGSDTVTSSGGGNSNGGLVDCYEVSGISSSSEHTSTGSGTATYNQANTLSVGSFTPSSSSFVVAFSEADLCYDGGGYSGHSSGFSSSANTGVDDYNPSSGSSGCYTNWFDDTTVSWDDYASSWGGGSTTASVTYYGPAEAINSPWVEVAASFASLVTQPITATPMFPGPKQLLAYWPFNEGSGTNAYDFSGNGYTGALVNAPTWLSGTSCKYGGCLSFNSASSQYLSVATYPNPSSSFTVSSWFKTSSASGLLPMLSHGYSGATTGFQLRVEGGEVQCAIYSAGSVSVTSASTYADNHWHLATCDFTSGSLLSLYVDGVSVQNATTTITSLANSNPFYIGRDGSGDYWSGSLDDIRVYGLAYVYSIATFRTAPPSPQTVTVSGCSASPTSITGDGTIQDVDAKSSCTITLTLPPGYVWVLPGYAPTSAGNKTSVTTCSSATCSTQPLLYEQFSSNINAYVNRNTNDCSAPEDPTVLLTFNSSMATTISSTNQWSEQINAYPSSNSADINWMQFMMGINSNGQIYGRIIYFEGAGTSVYDETTANLITGVSVHSGDKFGITVFQNDSSYTGVGEVEFSYYQSSLNRTLAIFYTTSEYTSVKVAAWQLNAVGENLASNPYANFTSGGGSSAHSATSNNLSWQSLQPSCVQAHLDGYAPYSTEESNMIYGAPTVSGTPKVVSQGADRQ